MAESAAVMNSNTPNKPQQASGAPARSLCARNSRIPTSRHVADNYGGWQRNIKPKLLNCGCLPKLGTNRRCQIPCDDSRSSNLPRSMVHSPGHAAAR